jgi:hypothetical protein
MGDILPVTSTACYAWALIPNHFTFFSGPGRNPYFQY